MENTNHADVDILMPILKQIPVFAELDETHHREIIQKIVMMYYPPQYVIFNEGDVGDALYIIKSGSVQIFHPPREEGDLPKQVADIPPGGFFGEMALISEIPRNASAKTLLESEIFILRQEDFKQLLSTNQNLAEKISSTMIDRLKENQQNSN